MAPWKLPLIVAAITVPIVAAFLTGGPAVGVAVGALAVVAILTVAARAKPRGPIESAPVTDSRRHVLIVATTALEDPAEVGQVARAAGFDGHGEEREDEVLVLGPVRTAFLDRWASDVEGARHQAQQGLVATVAALAKTGIAAEARVGDEDVVQAIEDQLQSFPATDVVLVSREAEGDGGDEAVELRARLQAKFRHVRLAG